MNLKSHRMSENKRTFMGKILFGLSIAVGILVFAVVGLALYVARTWDKVWEAPLPDVRVSKDPEVIKRGEYLVYGPAHCVECHSTGDSLDWLGEGVKLPSVAACDSSLDHSEQSMVRTSRPIPRRASVATPMHRLPA